VRILQLVLRRKELWTVSAPVIRDYEEELENSLLFWLKDMATKLS
jgi:hypothetical protein